MPMALSDRAADDLRFIRDAMAHAGAFTSVSGAGMIAVGAVGLAAALVDGAISWITIRRKANRAGQSLVDGPARRFALAFAPALVAGAAFMALGALRFALPVQARKLVLAAGFGGLHLSFGYQITRNYGG